MGSLPEDSGSLLGLKEHIQACIDSNSEKAKERFGPMLNVLNRSLFYLKISDYNTIGMEYRKGDKACPFYCFVRSKGNSSKREEPGTDIYVIGFGDLNMALDLLLSKDCDKMDAIRKYALQNFWPAIYWKKLELNIGGYQIFSYKGLLRKRTRAFGEM